jgi:hypothetical protein
LLRTGGDNSIFTANISPPAPKPAVKMGLGLVVKINL